MSALPSRSVLDGTGTPTTSAMKTALGDVYDYLAGLLGTTGLPADALAALGALSSSALGGNFNKSDPTTVGFTKTAAGTISIKAGTKVAADGTLLSFAVDTAVIMPALIAGTDYAIYACTDGTIRADASFSFPTGYTALTSRLIGGFHYGLVAPGTTVASGSFNTATATAWAMVWTQPDVDLIAGINAWSLWDLKWRSVSNDSAYRGQKGFAYNPAKREWVAIYFCPTDHITNGLSKYNTDVASGTVHPRKPISFGGNGAVNYAGATWYDFSRIVAEYGCRMFTEEGFHLAAYGVTEAQSLGGAASTIPSTLRAAGYTSKYGCEQMTGNLWIWGSDSNGNRVLLGGYRDDAASSGSRYANWTNAPSYVAWNIGVRAACDHLQLD